MWCICFAHMHSRWDCCQTYVWLRVSGCLLGLSVGSSICMFSFSDRSSVCLAALCDVWCFIQPYGRGLPLPTATLLGLSWRTCKFFEFVFQIKIVSCLELARGLFQVSLVLSVRPSTCCILFCGCCPMGCLVAYSTFPLHL